jgi:FlaA1/EpsC-like NDP-sugar epimerase
MKRDRLRSVGRLVRTVVPRKLQFTLDFLTVSAALVMAYQLRFDFSIPVAERSRLLAQLPYVVALELGALGVAGVYSFIWRYVGMTELKAFVKVGMFCGGILTVLRVGLPDPLATFRVPLSVIFIDVVLAFGGVLGLRVLRRLLYERYEARRRALQAQSSTVTPVLLVGAGQAGVLAAREINGRGDMHLQVKGFVDDDPEKQDGLIDGVRVLGTTADLPRLVRDLGIEQVVITIAQVSRAEMLRIMGICRSIPVQTRIVPGLYELLQGKVKVTRIRDVQIEDLLGREPVELAEDEVSRFIAGKAVMVTGAGGSIGAELARQVARFGPSALLLIERAEFALFAIDGELRREFPGVRVVALVADVADEARMRSIFREFRPEFVLHAAAHKHVPLMECNETEAIKNNVLATRLLGLIAGEFGAEAVVLISSDKAVNPTSVMGASKRVAEIVVQDLGRRFRTRFLAVRFGNVIGSTGSVIPVFREQIRRGGPVTVTHPDMNRYFMTIPEAAQLVLQAGSMGRGGEIFVLDMGKPVNILDLALQMIELTGLRPYEDMDIVFTGLRPGEKLFEELELSDENLRRTRHPKIMIGDLRIYSTQEVEWALERLREFAQGQDGAGIREFLNQFLPEARFNGHEIPEEASPGVARTPLAEEARV